MPKIQNCTSRPRQLNARVGKVGVITVSLQPDEVKEIPQEALDQLKTNPANARWFQMGLIKVVTGEKKETVKTEVVEVSPKKKVKTTKKKKSVKDLGL